MTSKIDRRHFLAAAATVGAAFVPHKSLAEPESASGGKPAPRDLIIDSHVHLKHGDGARTEYSAEVIVDTMDKVGIDRSVVFAMSTTTKRSIEMAEEAVKKYPERLIPYVYALPNYERPVIREIEEALAERRFRGIKIHIGECTLADYVIDPVLKLAGKHRVPCLIDLAGNLAVAERMARTFPETKIIIAHLGRYLCTDKKLIDRFIELAERQENVLLDVSGVVLVEKIAEAVKRIGSARLLWGSDGPHKAPDTFAFAQTELEKVRRLSLDEEAKKKILGRNIFNLLNLS